MADGSSDVYYDGMVHVRARQCDRCLFSRYRLVSGARARAIVRSIEAAQPGGSFICHRGQVSDEPTSICRAWWDRYAMSDILLRLAVATHSVTYVEGEGH